MGGKEAEMVEGMDAESVSLAFATADVEVRLEGGVGAEEAEGAEPEGAEGAEAEAEGAEEEKRS